MNVVVSDGVEKWRHKFCSVLVMDSATVKIYPLPLQDALTILGFVRAALSHWVMGFELTILSMVALIGLSGIVINDSIILVTTIDERLGRGEPFIEAIIAGSQDRLRAVILTSATTIGGLTPLIFETSLQAQDRKSVGEGKRVDLGGRRILKKKKANHRPTAHTSAHKTPVHVPSTPIARPRATTHPL